MTCTNWGEVVTTIATMIVILGFFGLIALMVWKA